MIDSTMYSIFIHQKDDLYKQVQIRSKKKVVEHVKKNSKGKRYIIAKMNDITEGFVV